MSKILKEDNSGALWLQDGVSYLLLDEDGVAPSGLASTVAFGVPSVASIRRIRPVGIASTAAIGVPAAKAARNLYDGIGAYVYISFTGNSADDPVWTDVTSYVREIRTKRGRQRELERWEPGTCTVVFDNRDRRFDPNHTGGPYYPNVLPMRRIKVEVVRSGITYPRFYGFTDGFPQTYDHADQTVSLTATDGFKVFASTQLHSAYRTSVEGSALRSLWQLATSTESLHGYQARIEGTTPTASIVPTETDGALDFNGASDCVTITDGLPTTSANSVEFWMRTSENQRNAPLVELGDGATRNVAIYLNFGSLNVTAIDNTAGWIPPSGGRSAQWDETWCPSFMDRIPGTKTTPTVQQAVDLALRTNLIVDFGTLTSKLGAMKAANPDVKVIYYMWPTFALGQGVADINNPVELTYPADWYLYADAAKTQHVWNLASGTDKFFAMMDISNSDWLDYQTNVVAPQKLALGFDGVFLDVMGGVPFDPGQLSAPPVHAGTSTQWTKSDWLVATAAFTDAMANGLHAAGHPDAVVLPNAIREGLTYADGTAPTAPLAGVGSRVAMCELFVRGPGGSVNTFRDETTWKADVDMLVDATANGNEIVCITKVWISTTLADSDNRRLYTYAYATFMLGADGRHSFAYSDTQDWSGLTSKRGFEYADLGTALGAYSKDAATNPDSSVGGCYRREFSRGTVVVNPTTTTRTAFLRTAMSVVDPVTGEPDPSPVLAVTLTANTAQILSLRTNAAIGWERATPGLNDGKAHHVVVNTDWDEQTIEVFVDGALATPDVFYATGTAIFVPPTTSYLGCAKFIADPSAPWYAGTLDQVAFYNGVMPAAEAAEHYNAGVAGWANDYTGTRVNRYLDAISWPTADRDIDPGDVQVQAFSGDGSTTLDALLALADSEYGALYVNASGKLRFRERRRAYTDPHMTSVQLVLSDTGAPFTLPYAKMSLSAQDALIRNDVRGSRRNGTEQSSSDAASIAKYLRFTYSLPTSLELRTDQEVKAICEAVLQEYKDPLQRIDGVQINMRQAPALSIPTVLPLELEYLVQITATPAGGGSPITQVGRIESIAEHITLDGYNVTLTLSPAEVRNWFTLDDNTRGFDLGKMGL